MLAVQITVLCLCRPVILPDYAELDLKIPDDARCPAWVCFDGKQVCLQRIWQWILQIRAIDIRFIRCLMLWLLLGLSTTQDSLDFNAVYSQHMPVMCVAAQACLGRYKFVIIDAVFDGSCLSVCL